MYNVYDIEDITEEKKEFVIDSDSKADWALSIIKQEQDEQQRLLNSIDEQIEILKAKRERIAENDKCRFLKGKLNEYFESIQDGKREMKTCIKYKLANGELVYTKPKVSYERDNDKIITWLSEHNKFEYIKTNPTVDWKELSKTEFFSQIDGVTEVTTEAKFEVKAL